MFSMNNILARAFYALDDIKTPMKISLVCLVLNLVFAILLVRTYEERGLGVANSVSATFNLGLLLYALRRKLARLGLTEVGRTLLALIPSAAAAGVIAAALSSVWESRLGHGTVPLKLGAVFVPGGVACLLYWLAALWLKVPAAQETTGLLLKRFGYRRPATATPEV
jgi:putative peptidoglycan lipid II flippase